MRRIAIGAFFIVTACATVEPSSLVSREESAVRAYFTSYPDHLFEAAEAACASPAQTLVRPSVNEVSCESLPEPELAAALILRHNGLVEDLPKLVVTLSGAQDSTGYLVTADTYIRIPQRSGTTEQLRFDDSQIHRSFKTLLEQAGGRPL